jgi:hypothetical protein
MIDTWSYPPDDMEDECDFCSEQCDGRFCSDSCRREYEADN